MSKVEQFKTLDDFEGYVFSSSDVQQLGPEELERFWRYEELGRVVFVAGTLSKWKDGGFIKKVVNKKKLQSLGMDVTKAYFKFVKGWKHPDDVELERVLKERRYMRYWERRTYADMVDRRVEEAEAVRAKRKKMEMEYYLDDERGWKKVKPGEHKRVHRKAKGIISPVEWDEEVKETDRED